MALSKQDLQIVDWDVEPQYKQTKLTSSKKFLYIYCQDIDLIEPHSLSLFILAATVVNVLILWACLII